MTLLGQDPHYFDLTYFEFTSEQAIAWLADDRRGPMTRSSSEDRFRAAAEAEGGASVSAGARVFHVRSAVEAGRVYYVDLSSLPDQERPAVIAEIKELVDRAFARVSAKGLNPATRSS